MTCLAATAVGVGALVGAARTTDRPVADAQRGEPIRDHPLPPRLPRADHRACGRRRRRQRLASRKLCPAGRRALIALVVVFAVARVVISWFPMDEPGGELTNHGRMHGLIAIVTFLAIAIAARRLGTVAQGVPGWATLATVSSVIAWLMVASLVAMMVVRTRRSRDATRRTELFRRGRAGVLSRHRRLAGAGRRRPHLSAMTAQVISSSFSRTA